MDPAQGMAGVDAGTRLQTKSRAPDCGRTGQFAAVHSGVMQTRPPRPRVRV